jgi:hypothetical protein
MIADVMHRKCALLHFGIGFPGAVGRGKQPQAQQTHAWLMKYVVFPWSPGAGNKCRKGSEYSARL